MGGVLKNIRVVDQGTFITGAGAGMILADMGADVIKVEPPHVGDPFRAFGDGYYSPHFQAYNRNKRSIALDLKDAADKETFRSLIAGADVYIQNFRPGAAARMGADYETLRAINPQLIYCSISGFGQDGPYVARPSYDTVSQALSGFLSVVTDPRDPRVLGPAIADSVTSTYGALGILGALNARAVTGKGVLCEFSMLEAMTHFAVEPYSGYFANGHVPDALYRPRLAQAHVLRCADGKPICIHLSSVPKFWENLVAMLDEPSLASDPRFETRMKRIENFDDLAATLKGLFAARPRAEWLARMGQYDLPYAPLYDLDEAIEDPQLKHLQIVVPVEGNDSEPERAGQAIRPPFVYDGVRATSVQAAPTIDQQGDAIRAALRRQPGAWPAADA